MVVVLIGGLWLACSVLSLGWTFAYFQGAFPVIAERYRDELRQIAFRLAIFGPVGLVVFSLSSKFPMWRYGWEWPSRRRA